MDKALTIVVTLDARPECQEQVRAHLRKLAKQTRQEAGNVFYILHEAIADPNRFVIYERWHDQSALDFHMAQPYLQCFLAASADSLQAPVSGTICREMEA